MRNEIMYLKYSKVGYPVTSYFLQVTSFAVQSTLEILTPETPGFFAN